MDVVEEGRLKQKRSLGRIFNEPNPIEENISDGEIVEEGEEEIVFPIKNTRTGEFLHANDAKRGQILETADF